MKIIASILGVSFAMATMSASSKPPMVAPDLIIINASVHTMDQARPTAGAVAIQGNRITAVGATPEIRELAGPATRVIDANEKLVFPGFNDAHVHWLMGGFSITNVNLRDARSTDELAR